MHSLIVLLVNGSTILQADYFRSKFVHVNWRWRVERDTSGRNSWLVLLMSSCLTCSMLWIPFCSSWKSFSFACDWTFYCDMYVNEFFFFWRTCFTMPIDFLEAFQYKKYIKFIWKYLDFIDCCTMIIGPFRMTTIRIDMIVFSFSGKEIIRHEYRLT